MDTMIMVADEFDVQIKEEKESVDIEESITDEAEEDLTIWISDDYNKVPLLAKAKIWVGSIRMELEKMEGELNKPNLLE